ncbi:MAG: hydantoinase B/oxoprolinase family protein [Thermodesulfobacteriota bacterium]|nr:hydantoinase B/oxoprolinase family protein [Thermodesulfobacteriota bacterium]
MKKKRFDIKDPITYEIFKHRLWSICERSHYTLSRVSGSPIVVDAHEYLSGIHKADGEAVMVTSGVVLHIVGMERAIKKINEWWKDEEGGIQDGDHFLVNDPFVAGIHATDMGITKPVFYEGKIVAWVGSLFHTPAVPAAMNPGGMCPDAINAYQEGLRAQALKIVEKGVQRSDIMRTLTANTHDPFLLGLDHVAKIAANNTASDEIIKMVDYFGLDYIERAFDRIIEETEEICRKKLRSLPDGKYRSILYQDTSGREVKPIKIQCTLTKKEDKIYFDYTGTDPQQQGSYECAEPGALGHLFVVLATQLFWDSPWGSGILKSIDYHFPEGSLLNVDFPMPVSNAPLVVTSENVAHQCIVKMLSIGEKFREDINAGWSGVGAAPAFFGVNQYGKNFSTIIMDSFAGGHGGRVDMDGVNSGGQMMTPESEISNVETQEMFYPILYLWRKETVESFGHGKFRGGLGIEDAITVHNAPRKNLMCTNVLSGDTLSNTFGLSGGYPGGLSRFTIVENSNIEEVLEKGFVPSSLDDVEGEKKRLSSSLGIYVWKEGDIIHFFTCSGGGGYGDPLDRDPDLVLKDIKYGAIKFETAKGIYGVSIDPKDMKIDLKETEEERKRMREERLKRGKRTVGTVNSENNKLQDGKKKIRITEYLFVVDKEGVPVIVCDRCGFLFCKAVENYKLYALFDERLSGQIGLSVANHPEDDSGMVYREFFCPGCGVLLEVEATMKGSPILYDMEPSLKL